MKEKKQGKTRAVEQPAMEPSGSLCLGLLAWSNEVGVENTRKVCKEAGLSTHYFAMMANYLHPCTPSMFERILAAARSITPASLPDYETCTRQSIRSAMLAVREKISIVQTEKQEKLIAAAFHVEQQAGQERAMRLRKNI